VRDRHLAEDIFQEVSLTAIRKSADIENQAALSGWLRSTARFIALNALRKRQRRSETLDDAILDLLDEQWTAAESNQCSETALEALRRCMAKLAPGAQRLVHLRYHEGLSGKALADRMGKSLNTIYVGLTRVHRFLEHCMKAQMATRGAYNDG